MTDASETATSPLKLESLVPRFVSDQHGTYRDELVDLLTDDGRRARVWNIALTGGYGSGKSSVLAGVRDQLGKRVVEISLSSLSDVGVESGDANEAPLALKTGGGLAAFQKEVATDPHLTSVRHDAIAHSWGLAATTASELKGARYDNVVSLSGAWMPPGWEGQSNTAYSHYTYTDFLTVAKGLDLVGAGNIPDTNPAFTKPLGDPIPTHGDWTLALPTSSSPYAASEPVRIPMNTDLAGTHSLVASSDNDNLAILRSVQRDLLR